MHKFSDGIVQFAGCIDASFAAISQEMLLELEDVLVDQFDWHLSGADSRDIRHHLQEQEQKDYDPNVVSSVGLELSACHLVPGLELVFCIFPGPPSPPHSRF